MKRGQYLVLTRHGETLANTLVAMDSDEHFYEVTGSDRSAELNNNGVAQMRNTAGKIRRFLKKQKVSRIIATSYRRTQHSAEIVANEFGYDIPVIIDERLDKRSYGRFWNITYKGVRELFPEEQRKLEQQGVLAYRPPDGENYYDLFERVADAFTDVSEFAGRVQILVCHSVAFLAIQKEIDGLSAEHVYNRYESIQVGNGEIVVYFRPQPGRPWRQIDITKRMPRGRARLSELSLFRKAA